MPGYSGEICALLVDDERGILDQGEIFLKKEIDDLSLKTTPSPRKALDLLDEGAFDAVVSDYEMPGMDGLEFLKTIRRERNSDIPFIIFTGKGREEVAIEALNLGADRYLQKGTDPKSQYGVLAQAIVQEVERSRSQEKIRSLAKYPSENPVPVLRVRNDGKVLYSNDPGKELLSEWEVGERDMVPEKWQKLIGEAFDSGKIITKEITASGNVFSLSINPISGEKYANLYAPDITERKRKEEKLRELEEEKSLILNNTEEIIAYHDTNHNIQWTNRAYGEAVGDEPDNLEGRKCYSIWLQEDEPCENCPVTKAIETGETQEGELSLPGQGHWHVRGTPVRDDKGDLTGAIETAHDITRRKKAVEKARKTARELTKTLDGMKEPLLLLDENHHILLANSSAEEIYGASREKMIGGKCYEIVHGDETHQEGCPLEKSLENGETEELELQDSDDDGHFLIRAYPITEEGETRKVVHQQIDITDRKRAEEREEFLHSLLRHDIRNRIQVIQGFVEVLDDLDLPGEVEKYVTKLKDGVEEASQTIEKIRSLRRIGEEPKIEEVSVGSVIDEVIEGNQDRISESGIELVYEGFDRPVRGGPLLKELFSNLVENSVRHSNCDKIRVGFEENEEECVVTVEDDGKGIPDEEKEDVFDRGFKSEESPGSGLGMHLVREIVENYEGSIEVKDSGLGGARFDVHLKRADGVVEQNGE